MFYKYGFEKHSKDSKWNKTTVIRLVENVYYTATLDVMGRLFIPLLIFYHFTFWTHLGDWSGFTVDLTTVKHVWNWLLYDSWKPTGMWLPHFLSPYCLILLNVTWMYNFVECPQRLALHIGMWHNLEPGKCENWLCATNSPRCTFKQLVNAVADKLCLKPWRHIQTRIKGF